MTTTLFGDDAMIAVEGGETASALKVVAVRVGLALELTVHVYYQRETVMKSIESNEC